MSFLENCSKTTMAVIIVGLLAAAGAGGALAYTSIFMDDIPQQPITTDSLMVNVFNNSYGHETASVDSMTFEINQPEPVVGDDGKLVFSAVARTSSPYYIRVFSTGTENAELYGFFTTTDFYGAVVRSISFTLAGVDDPVTVTLYRDSFGSALIPDVSLSGYDGAKGIHYKDYGITSVTINYYGGIVFKNVGDRDVVYVTDDDGVVNEVTEDVALDLTHFGFTFLASRGEILASA